MALKYFSVEISSRQVTMYNDHYALVQQYNRLEPLQSNIAGEQRRTRMMGELSYRGTCILKKSLSPVFHCGHTVWGNNLPNFGSPLHNAN